MTTLHFRSGPNPPLEPSDHCREATVQDWIEHGFRLGAEKVETDIIKTPDGAMRVIEIGGPSGSYLVFRIEENR